MKISNFETSWFVAASAEKGMQFGAESRSGMKITPFQLDFRLGKSTVHMDSEMLANSLSPDTKAYSSV